MAMAQLTLGPLSQLKSKCKCKNHLATSLEFLTVLMSWLRSSLIMNIYQIHAVAFVILFSCFTRVMILRNYFVMRPECDRWVPQQRWPPDGELEWHPCHLTLADIPQPTKREASVECH